ncbi:mechanosensitive ion channel family protein [Pseudomonadota bacterium]
MRKPALILSLALLFMSGLVFAQEEVNTHDPLKAEHSVDELQLLTAPLTLEQLTAEAAKWQSRVQAAMSGVARLKVEALTATGDRVSKIHDEINALSTRRVEIVDKYNLILDAMELKGGDPELISTYRQYITGAIASEFQATDAKTILSRAVDWTISVDGGGSLMVRIATILGSLFVLILAAKLVRSIARRGIRRISNLSVLLQDFLLKVIYWLTFAIGLMIVLSVLGIDITPLFAVVGGASFIIAFAMQETLGNLAAGLMIMINKPFDVGDLVDTNGILGEVEAVSIVSTTVRTLDNQVVILPNSQVWGSIITNVTVSPVRRVDMVFGIGYGDDIETASQVLQGLVSSHPLILKEPKPNIKVHELADSSVNFICRPWVKTENYWDVYWDLTRQAKEEFDKAGVSIPFPQRDVHLYSET